MAQPKTRITFISSAVPPPPYHRAMQAALLYNPSWVPQGSLSHEAGVTPAVLSAQHHRGAQLPLLHLQAVSTSHCLTEARLCLTNSEESLSF